MRCFIAIDLPDEIKKELAKAQKALPIEDAKLTNVNPELLHLTLRFLGEISDFQVNKIKEILKKIKLNKFRAKLNSIGIFPNENFIRVVWVGLEPNDKFNDLRNEIEKELEKAGFKKDERFESHVTLTRIKWLKDKKNFVEKIKKIKVKSLEFEVEDIKLKKSALSPKGPVYEDIFKVNLI
jgi:2'-5' RNA ligase